MIVQGEVGLREDLVFVVCPRDECQRVIFYHYTKEKGARNRSITSLVLWGFTLKEVGRSYGISEPRVRQIALREATAAAVRLGLDKSEIGNISNLRRHKNRIVAELRGNEA